MRRRQPGEERKEGRLRKETEQENLGQAWELERREVRLY